MALDPVHMWTGRSALSDHPSLAAESALRMGDERGDFRRIGADRHRADSARDDLDIIKLGHRTIDAEPFGAASLAQVDDLEAAPGFAVRACVSRWSSAKPLEPLVAGFGQAHDGIIAPEGEPAQEARTEDARHETAHAGPRGLRPRPIRRCRSSAPRVRPR